MEGARDRVKQLWIAVGFSALIADAASACSCAGSITVANQFAHAPIVFVGRVESVRDRWSPFAKFWLKIRRLFNEEARPEIEYNRYCTNYGMEVTFAVQQAWKGVASRRVVLLTGRGGGDCGVDFKPGVDYIVYAYPPAGDGCQTTICTRTGELTGGAEDLEFLRHYPALRIR